METAPIVSAQQDLPSLALSPTSQRTRAAAATYISHDGTDHQFEKERDI